MHDAIAIERLGTPAVVVCTDVFETTARQMATLQGVPDFPVVFIPHPLGRCPHDELRAKAEAVLENVVDLLTSQHLA